MAKSPSEMKASMIAGLQEKTGKTLAQWHDILRAAGVAKHKECMTLLKETHGITHGFANMISLQFLNTDSQTANDTDALVTAQYAGTKAGLRPIYDALLAAVRKFGTDVEVSPKKAYVSIRRAKQFAIVQPSTATRVDVGLVLKATEATERLEIAGSFNAMVTHRVRLETVADVNAQLVKWLKQAYQEGTKA